jgi:hypothetical protein
MLLCQRLAITDERLRTNANVGVAGDAVLIAPVSRANSLLTGNFTGKIATSRTIPYAN